MSKLLSVVQGFLELESGKGVSIETPQWLEWLDTSQSFRYCPKSFDTPFTVRKERSKRGETDYWYGYRKVNGKLHKRYVGKTSDLTLTRLEEIAEQLNVKSPLRPAMVTDKSVSVTNSDELARLQNQATELQKEVDRLQKQVQVQQEHLELKTARLAEIRDRTLNKLKMGRQSAAGKAIDAFIKELQRE